MKMLDRCASDAQMTLNSGNGMIGCFKSQYILSICYLANFYFAEINHITKRIY